MQVKVTIVTSARPQGPDLENLRLAASELTNKQGSITVNVVEADGRFSLVTRFSMKTAAQYKVVDRISHQFELWTWNLAGYQDMIISFPG
jgi:hypothetical protein